MLYSAADISFAKMNVIYILESFAIRTIADEVTESISNDEKPLLYLRCFFGRSGLEVSIVVHSERGTRVSFKGVSRVFHIHGRITQIQHSQLGYIVSGAQCGLSNLEGLP